MPTKLIIGLQWGDEGKGKVVDSLVHEWADVCVRYQGGPNAGHTIYDNEGKKYVTHALPSGILKKDCLNIISKGCVVEPNSLFKEIKSFSFDSSFLKISCQCPLILPHHVLIDKLKYQSKIGTTAKGIGPAYSEYIARDNKTMHDLCFNFDELTNYIYNSLLALNQKYSDDHLNAFLENFINENSYSTELKSISYKDNLIEFLHHEYFEILNILKSVFVNYIIDSDKLIQDLYRDKKNIVLEGAQGWGLDVWGKSYPNVTSSSPNVGGALTYTGLNHKQIDEVIGVVKIYKSKVGTGDFSTEWPETHELRQLRLKLGEYGATTGRPRRLGDLDLDEIKNACLTNGIDSIVITRVDNVPDLPFFQIKHNNEKIFFSKWSHKEEMMKEDLENESIKNFIDYFKEVTKVNRIGLSYGKKRKQLEWLH
jgi:adenylosuccinate synthase